MYIISISNQKGGVGKTTLTVNLASEFARKGWRVLVVDMDEQCNATNFYQDTEGNSIHTIYSVLTDQAIAQQCIQHVDKSLDLIPGSPDIKFFDSEDETLLKRAIQTSYFQNRYDIVFIDNPPAINNKTLNSYTASTHVLLVTEAGEFSVDGLRRFNRDIQNIQTLSNPNLSVVGILINKVHGRRKLDQSYICNIRYAYPDLTFHQCLNDYSEIQRATSASETVCDGFPGSKAATQIRAITEELMIRLNRSKANGNEKATQDTKDSDAKS